MITQSRRYLFFALALAFCTAAAHADSSYTIKFNVPVNLSNLDPRVTAVAVTCGVGPDVSSAKSLNQRVASASLAPAVVNQALNTTLTLPVTFSADKAGSVKAWYCGMNFFTQTQGGLAAEPGTSSPSPVAQMAPGGTYSAQGTF